MPSLKVASLYLFLGYIFLQPDKAAKAIRLFSFHLKSHEPTSQSNRNGSCLALVLVGLCDSSLLGFLGLPWSLQPRKAPCISQRSWTICKYFAITEGQEKSGLAIFCTAQQAFCPALAMRQKVHFLALLTKRTQHSLGARANTNHHPCDYPLAPTRLGPSSPWRVAEWVSRMELHRADFSGPWVQTLPPLVGFIVSLCKKAFVKQRQRQCHSWTDYPSGTPESCV